jgi:TnpA family transposase
MLEPMIGGVANFALIEENWDDYLRLAAAIRMGTVAPSASPCRLAAYPRQNAQAKTLREIGCIERTKRLPPSSQPTFVLPRCR